MKKLITAAVIFILVFIGVYLATCFAVPGMRIKLAAPPIEYFYKSIVHMASIKVTISFALALLAVMLTKAVLNRK